MISEDLEWGKNTKLKQMKKKSVMSAEIKQYMNWRLKKVLNLIMLQ